jgi:hypothetical protein
MVMVGLLNGRKQPPATKHDVVRKKLFKKMRRGKTGYWLAATFLLALLTWILLQFCQTMKGHPLFIHLKVLAMLGMVATWGLAMRAIREKLLELFNVWILGRRKLNQQAMDAGKRRPVREKGNFHSFFFGRSILFLRLIAIGITMPFFFLPLFGAFLGLALGLQYGWDPTGLILFLLISSILALAVGLYFRWAIVLVPAKARPHGPHYFFSRVPKGKV